LAWIPPSPRSTTGHDDSDIRARAALTMLGLQRGWRIADIGCGKRRVGLRGRR